MNPGLVTSFIIAGILLLSILSLNLRVSQSGTELALSQMLRQQMSTVTQMINEDLPNMGFDLDRTTTPVLTHADESRIQFYRNVYRDPDRQPEKVTWELLDQPVEGSANSDHRVLIRVEEETATGDPDTTKFRSGVTRFELSYFSDRHGKEMSEAMSPPPGPDSTALATVKQIHMVLELQSEERFSTRAGDEGRYLRSVYEKRFSPRNLE